MPPYGRLWIYPVLGPDFVFCFLYTVLCKSNKSELRRISLIVLANFRRYFVRTFAPFSRNFARSLENSQSETKYRRSKFFNSRKFEEILLKRNEISANFHAIKARSCGFRDSLRRFHLLHLKKFIHEQKSLIK